LRKLLKFIRKDHQLMRLQVFVVEPNTGQSLDPVWIIIFSH
jgi:dipeptide/tripeptide permease